MSAPKTTITFPNTLTNNTDADATEVMANFNAIATAVGTTGFGTDNIKDEAITTAKIEDGAVTGAKLNSNTVDDSSLEISSSTIQIKDGGVSQAKLAARSTGTSVSAGGIAISESSGSFTTTSSSYADVTNLEVTITTTGRPVWLGLVSDGSGNSSYVRGKTVYTVSGARGSSIKLIFLRGSTEIAEYHPGFTLPDLSSSATGFTFDEPPSAFIHIDIIEAGTYTYKVQTSIPSASTGSSASVIRCKLVAYEL